MTTCTLIEKTSDIAIFRSQGLSPGAVMTAALEVASATRGALTEGRVLSYTPEATEVAFKPASLWEHLSLGHAFSASAHPDPIADVAWVLNAPLAAFGYGDKQHPKYGNIGTENAQLLIGYGAGYATRCSLTFEAESPIVGPHHAVFSHWDLSSVSHGGRRCLTAGGHHLTLWTLDGQEERQISLQGLVGLARLTADGEHLAAVVDQTSLLGFNAQGDELWKKSFIHNEITDLLVNEEGQGFWVALSSGQVHLVDKAGTITTSLTALSEPIVALSLQGGVLTVSGKTQAKRFSQGIEQEIITRDPHSLYSAILSGDDLIVSHPYSTERLDLSNGLSTRLSSRFDYSTSEDRLTGAANNLHQNYGSRLRSNARDRLLIYRRHPKPKKGLPGGRIFVVDRTQGLLKTLDVPPCHTTVPLISPDGCSVLVTDTQDKASKLTRARLFAVADPAVIELPFPKKAKEITDGAFLGDDQIILAFGKGGLGVYDRSGQLKATSPLPVNELFCEGETILAVTDGDVIHLSPNLFELARHPGQAHDLSSDGRFAVCTDGEDEFLWDLSTYTTHLLPAHILPAAPHISRDRSYGFGSSNNLLFIYEHYVLSIYRLPEFSLVATNIATSTADVSVGASGDGYLVYTQSKVYRSDAEPQVISLPEPNSGDITDGLIPGVKTRINQHFICRDGGHCYAPWAVVFTAEELRLKPATYYSDHHRWQALTT